MSCERFGSAIAAHAAGAALDPAAGRHIAGCEACRRLLDRQAQMLAELDAELGRSLSLTASPDFVARVARGARDAGATPVRRWIPAPVWAGAGVAAAILLAVWIGDFRLKPEATQTIREGVQRRPEAARTSSADVRLKPETVQTRGSLAPGCVASGVSRKAATGGCRAAPLAAARRPVSADPPVIVEPERALAIARLRELMTQGRLNEKMLPPPVTPEAALAELTIAPLEIAEIRVPDVEIVGRPPAAPERQ